MNARPRSLILVNGGLLLILLPVFYLLSTDKQSEQNADSGSELVTERDEGLPPIMKTVEEYGSLTVLATLLRETGMVEELAGDGPYTLLAPDDSAFGQLQPEQLERLMSDREYAKDILARHLVAGRRVEFGENIETLTMKTRKGEVIAAEITDDAVKIEQAWIIDEQLECSNGIIHVIDAVLLNKGKQKG